MAIYPASLRFGHIVSTFTLSNPPNHMQSSYHHHHFTGEKLRPNSDSCLTQKYIPHSSSISQYYLSKCECTDFKILKKIAGTRLWLHQGQDYNFWMACFLDICLAVCYSEKFREIHGLPFLSSGPAAYSSQSLGLSYSGHLLLVTRPSPSALG